MKMKLSLVSFIFIFVLPQVGFSACPDWLKNSMAKMPSCPAGETIPETYPVGAVVVSDLGFRGKDSRFTMDFVEKVLRSSGKDAPLILLPVENETIEQIKARINAMNLSSDKKTQWLKSLVQVPAQSYTWQQDYFQAFVNPKTGLPVLRSVQGYSRSHTSMDRLVEATRDCGFEKGADLVTDRFVNGAMGGNIQTLPSGLCALGDDHFRSDAEWSTYADQFCGKDADNRIKVPTSWLSVGHTDEIMKTVRNKKQPAPCDFSVVVASPKKAIELLKAAPDEPFVDFSSRSDTNMTELTQRRCRDYVGLRGISRTIKDLKDSPDSLEKAPASRSKSISRLIHISEPEAQAAFQDVTPKKEASENGDCSRLTNGDLVSLMTGNTDLKIYNELVQQKMNDLKQTVAEKLKAKFPQCHIDIFDTPDLFFGGSPVKGPNGYELPNRMGLSILPNPTNAVSINDTVISPEPSNSAFKKYIKAQFETRGLGTEFVDTFDYAHQGQGNLHCSTHTIQICNPRKSK